YLKPENTASAEWLQLINEKAVPNTITKEIQSIDSFNSFYPMEIIATAKETNAIIAKSKRKDFIVFPEDRSNPIKMPDRLPQRWIQKGLTSSFNASASKGEYYAFQLGVYALKQVEDISVKFSDIKDGKGHLISAKN